MKEGWEKGQVVEFEVDLTLSIAMIDEEESSGIYAEGVVRRVGIEWIEVNWVNENGYAKSHIFYFEDHELPSFPKLKVRAPIVGDSVKIKSNLVSKYSNANHPILQGKITKIYSGIYDIKFDCCQKCVKCVAIRRSVFDLLINDDAEYINKKQALENWINQKEL